MFIDVAENLVFSVKLKFEGIIKMRRSCAPTMKRISEDSKSGCKLSVDSVSSTSSVGVSNQSSKVNHIRNINKSNKRLFNIVWRKVTTKKHKTWEGDGILEVRTDNGSCSMKSENGEYLGTSVIKLEDLVDGFLFTTNGKEIEIQSEVVDLKLFYENQQIETLSREVKCASSEPLEKKPKCTPGFFRPLLNLSAPKKKPPRTEHVISNSNVIGCDPLILPTPPDTDFCKFNKLNQAIYEVRVPQSIVQHLRQHDREGVLFLYECIMGFKTPHYYGAILADGMKLDNTLQCLGVACTLLKQGPFGGDSVIQRVLITTSNNLNWSRGISKWLRNERLYAFVIDGKHKLIQYMSQTYIPFVIVSHEIFLANVEEFQTFDFDMLICDEAHCLENYAAKMADALRDMNIMRRIVLTSTPLQNNLRELFLLSEFVNPGILGSYSNFKEDYEVPIMKSQVTNASEEIRQFGAKCFEKLNIISSQYILQRTKDISSEHIPSKKVHLIFVRPSELQQCLLKKALEFWEQHSDDILLDVKPFQIITTFQKICNHPSLITRIKSSNLLTRMLERQLPHWTEMGPFDSAKLEVVQNILKETVIKKREKILLVSNYTKTLDMLEGLCDHLNLKVCRLDETTSAMDRSVIVEEFNIRNQENGTYIFLLSAKAGDIGVNIIGTSRLILFDINLSRPTEDQVVSRIWRDGQKNDLQIYHLITCGTVEEKLFQRHISKSSPRDCVISTNKEILSNFVKLTIDDLNDIFTPTETFDECDSHSLLNCDCQGDGKNINDFVLRSKPANIQIDKLHNWEHHFAPFDTTFLKDAKLTSSADSIILIFSNKIF